MKKTIKVVASVVLCIVLMLTVVACAQSPVVQEESAVIVTATEKYMNKMEGDKLKGYLDVLVAEELLTYEAPGGFITSINGKTPEEGAYWMIYASDKENTVEGYDYEYNGKTWYSLNFGINDMPIKEGVEYLFVIIKF